MRQYLVAGSRRFPTYRLIVYAIKLARRLLQQLAYGFLVLRSRLAEDGDYVLRPPPPPPFPSSQNKIESVCLDDVASAAKSHDFRLLKAIPFRYKQPQKLRTLQYC